MSALRDTVVPVPTVLGSCDDLAVNDAPFYVMAKVDGIIYRDARALATLSAADAGRVSHALVDVLADIHAVDFAAVGLADFGRPDGYCERQVRRWGEQWERSKTREIPAVDEVARRLRAAACAWRPECAPDAACERRKRVSTVALLRHAPCGRNGTRSAEKVRSAARRLAARVVPPPYDVAEN